MSKGKLGIILEEVDEKYGIKYFRISSEKEIEDLTLLELDYVGYRNSKHVLVGVSGGGMLDAEYEQKLVNNFIENRDNKDIKFYLNRDKSADIFLIYLKASGGATVYQVKGKSTDIKFKTDTRPICDDEYYGLMVQGTVEQAKEITESLLEIWK